MSSSGSFRRRAALALALGATACSPSSTVKVALYGDLPALQREIERADRAGELDRGAVVKLADALARRELAAAQGESGARRVRQLRACTLPLSDALSERAEGKDDVAAEAALALLAQRKLEAEPLLEAHARDANGAWRGVAARAALRRTDVAQRRRWFEDPDQRVRRAAFEAALEAPDAGDLDAALESLRLDPDPLVQSLAARLVGKLGGEAAVLGLRDRYDRADGPTQLGIIEAWAAPAAFRAGGERELRRVLELAQDTTSVAAARALLGWAPIDAAVLGVLEHAIRDGGDAERRLAIAAAPTDDESIVKALLAAQDQEPPIAAAAWERLSALPRHRTEAFRALRSLAQAKGAAGEDARAVLARLGDRTVVPALIADVKTAQPWRRQAAALDLFDLGEAGAAARALADPDPGVRTNVACGVLSRDFRG
jgi:hypothetical protein